MPTTESPGLIRLLPWIAAFVPGVIMLVMMWSLRATLPYLDGWSYVQQYAHWVDGRYGWSDFLEPHYIHPSAVGKAVCFAILHWFGGDMSLMTLIMWLMAVVMTGCICYLSRPLWKESPAWGAAGAFMVGLTIFSAAQGEVWIWGFLFQNSVPSACLAVGLAVLARGVLSAWRITVAGLMVIIATFSFGSGPLVGMMLAIFIWRGTEGKSTPRRWMAAIAWLVFCGVVAALALLPLLHVEEPITPKVLLDHPLMRVQFILILLGQMLGKGTAFEPSTVCALMGGILVIVFVACSVHVFRHRRDRELVDAALPWLALCLFGLGTAVLICIARSFNSLANSIEERYSALTFFFLLGTVFLAATVVRRGTDAPWIRVMRMAATPALVILLLAHAVNWERGWHGMKLKHKSMEQERAMLSFVHVLPPDAAWMQSRLTRKSSLSMTKFLAERNRIKDVKFVPDTRVASFTRGTKAPKQWSRFDEPQLLGDGRWLLRGIGGLAAGSAADLVLITMQSENPAAAGSAGQERIIGLAAPFLPDTFFEREAQTRRHTEHYLGWKHFIDANFLPRGRIILRAYVFEQDGQKLRPMEGEHVVGDEDVESAEVGRPGLME